jgi:hypothetical protein
MPSIIKVDQIQSDTGTVNLASNIAFASASVLGNVNFDSGTMFVDATNNRVGVGTTTPTSPLDVNGLIRTTGFVTNPASGAGMEMAWDGTQGIIQAFSNRATLTTAPITFSGGQIKFPATQNSSADANTLDDYEEGTFTVTLLSTSGTITVNSGNNTGLYTKIGRIVNLSGFIDVSSVGSPSGRLRISGLPFNPVSDGVPVGICYFTTTNAFTGVPWCLGENGNPHIYIDRNAGTGADPAVDLASAMKAGSEIYFNFTYTTS